MTATGRLAQGERALAHTETFVAACRSVATVPLTPERVDELYRAEGGAGGRVTLQTAIKLFDVDPVTLTQTFVGTHQPVVEAEVPCSSTRR